MRVFMKNVYFYSEYPTIYLVDRYDQQCSPNLLLVSKDLRNLTPIGCLVLFLEISFR